MRIDSTLRLTASFALLLLTSCGDDDAPAGEPAGSCTARVTIAFYRDATCSAESQVGMRAYDTSLECFSWTAMGSSAAENSATRFQCYRDRLCYTQHPNTLDCGEGGRGQTDKEARVGVCLKEPDGELYSMIVSGTDDCPDAPAGFACASSAPMMGTAGLAECTTQ